MSEPDLPPSQGQPAADATTPARRGRGAWRTAAWLVGLALLLGYAWMFSDITVPNERSRVYLTTSLVDCGTIDIDCAVKRFGPVNDWARHDGHYYTDKAPGSSLLGAVPYLVVRVFTDPEDWTIAELVNLERRGLMIPLALFGALLFLRIARALGVGERAAHVAMLAWLLGSTALHYSGAFYGHQIVAVLHLAAIYHGLVRPLAARPRAGLDPGLLWAGAAAGMAGLVEYQAIPASAIIALGVLHRAWRAGHVARFAGFVAAALPFGLVFVWYHDKAFGGPLELSYKHLVSGAIQAAHTRGIGGVGMPRPEAIHGVLTTLHRGLLVTAPIVLLAPWGLARLRRIASPTPDGAPIGRRLMVVLSLSIVLGLFTAFGADAWFGGWSFGPRLLVPILPWLMLGVALALDDPRWGRAGAGRSAAAGVVFGAILVGVLYNWVAKVAFPELPEDVGNPLRDLIGPMLGAGQLSPNVVSALTGARGLATLVPLGLALIGVLVWIARALHRPIVSAGVSADVSAGTSAGAGASAGRAWALWALGATIVPAVFAAYVALRPPTWSEAQRRDWKAVVTRWEQIEKRQ